MARDAPGSVITGADDRASYVSRQLGVTSLTCAGERAGLKRRLMGKPDVVEVIANSVTERAYLGYDPAVTTLSALIDVIEAPGYGVE
jgi:hypothetical protein